MKRKGCGNHVAQANIKEKKALMQACFWQK
jgi:hypothetical protein